MSLWWWATWALRTQKANRPTPSVRVCWRRYLSRPQWDDNLQAGGRFLLVATGKWRRPIKCCFQNVWGLIGWFIITRTWMTTFSSRMWAPGKHLVYAGVLPTRLTFKSRKQESRGTVSGGDGGRSGQHRTAEGWEVMKDNCSLPCLVWTVCWIRNV